MKLKLIKIIETGPKTHKQKMYQALTEDQLEGVQDTQSSYSYIGRDFDIEYLGEVEVFPDIKDLEWKNYLND